MLDTGLFSSYMEYCRDVTLLWGISDVSAKLGLVYTLSQQVLLAANHHFVSMAWIVGLHEELTPEYLLRCEKKFYKSVFIISNLKVN